MAVGGLISRIARKGLPSLFKAAKPGAIEAGLIPIQTVLRNRGGPVGGEIAQALRSSRNIARRSQGKYMQTVKPELTSLNPLENEQLARGLLGEVAEGRSGQLIAGMDGIFQTTGKTPKKIVEKIIARGTPISDATKKDGRALLKMVFDQHEDEMTKALIKRQAQPLVNQLAKGPFRELAQKGINNVLTESGGDPFLSGLRSFNTMTLLGRAVLANSTQTSLSTITAGLRPLRKQIGTMLSKEGREATRDFAAQIGEAFDGAISDYIRHDLTPSRIQRGASSVLRRTGFLAVERFNRRFAAGMARHWFADLTRKAKLGDDLALRQFERFGVDPKKAAKGALNQTDLEEFSQNFVTDTQIRATPEELPLTASDPVLGPYWKTVMQFKQFGLKATELMLKDIETQGLGKTLSRAVPISIGVGVPLAAARRVTAGKSPIPEDWMELVKSGAFAVGYGALFFDAVQAVERGGTAEFIGGPSLGLAQDVGQAISGVARGDLRAPASKVIERIPAVGPAARRGFQAITKPTPPRRGRPGRPGRSGRPGREGR